ncbi:MAG: hypothetical protein JO337_09130 [Acidimicrobiales bacterium]|nr:hypothetical protein [Acidimicrobiales bacterium]
MAADASVWVFAPSPLLTVTVERSPEASEVHLHVGGQGYWLARLIRAFGLRVVVSASFGGETGRVLESLLAAEGFEVRSIKAAGSNGAYVHDRRSGERVEVAEMCPAPLARHEIDDLYGASLVAGLDASVCVLGGPPNPSVVAADIYRRLAGDLRANGKTVVADLSDTLAEAVLDGGVSILKMSEDQLPGSDRRRGVPGLVEAMKRLAAAGAESVVISRGDQPALALLDGRLVEARGPRLAPVDDTGRCDSLTAGMAAALAEGKDLDDALRLGVAAGSLNVTRRGLGSGRREDTERLAQRVELFEVNDP